MDSDLILKQRARVLAKAGAGDEKPYRLFNAVCFARGKEHYAIETVNVREVQPFNPETCCRVPGPAGSLFGISNIRGKILAIIDFALLFEHDAEPEEAAYLIILAEEETKTGEIRTAAVLADGLPFFQDFAFSEIRPIKEMVYLKDKGFVIGVVKDHMIVDSKTLLIGGYIAPDGENRNSREEI